MLEFVAGGVFGSVWTYLWRHPRRPVEAPRARILIHTKVVGVTFEGRQHLIRHYVYAGADLVLRAEPDNPHDPNAIGVWLARPKVKIGYVPRDLAADLKGEAGLTASVTNLRGGGEYPLGVGIKIEG